MSKATGAQSDARFETSAAWAEAETSNVKLADEVEKNAEKMHHAARDAAATAQRRSSVSAVDQLEQSLSAKTSQATAEGEANVQGYVAQAKNLASSALATAQSYLPGSGSTSSGTADTGATPSGGITATLQSAASGAVGAGVSAVQTARATVTPYVQGATDAVAQAVTGSTANAPSNQPEKVAPKTAPLESGQQVLEGGPYQGPSKA